MMNVIYALVTNVTSFWESSLYKRSGKDGQNEITDLFTTAEEHCLEDKKSIEKEDGHTKRVHEKVRVEEKNIIVYAPPGNNDLLSICYQIAHSYLRNDYSQFFTNNSSIRYICHTWKKLTDKTDYISTLDKIIVININVLEQEIIQRIAGRLTCKKCGNVHHKEFSPPQRASICDKCGGELYQRSDDQVEVIEKRLEAYRKQTAPLIDFYAQKKVLSHTDGNQSPETVFTEMIKVLETHLTQKE